MKDKLPANIPEFNPNAQIEDVHLRDYLNILYRRRRAFLAGFAAVMLVVTLFTFLTRPVYEAKATLHVRDVKPTNTGNEVLDLLQANRMNPVEAELEILKSRSNAEKTVKQLNLHWQINQKSEGVSFQLLEFTSSAKKPFYEIELSGKDGYVVRDREGKVVGVGRSGQLMRGKGMNLLLAELRGKKGDTFELKLLNFNTTVNTLKKRLRAAVVGNKTNVISIAYRDKDPHRAQEVVNTVVHAYLEQSMGFKSEEASRTVNFVEDQMDGIRSELDSAEKNLQSYKSKTGVVMLDPTAQNLITKFSDTEKERAGIGIQRKRIEIALEALEDAKRRGTTYSPAISKDDPLLSGMAARLAELEVKKSELLTDSTEAHPAVKAVKEQIDESLRKIQSTYESELRDITRQEREISRVLGGYEGMLKGLPAAERDLAKLTRLSKVNADIYTFLLQKREEARITKASTISNINIVDPAILPEEPVEPQKLKYLLLGFLLAGLTGAGLSFFREYFDDTIKNAEDAKRELNWPLLGVIPHINALERGRRERKIPLLTHLEPKSQTSEAFRCFRTGINFSCLQKQRQVILLTSTFPSEGKSTIVTNLASVCSQNGSRVAVLDCDLRRSSLHEKYNCPREPGLADYLQGKIQLREAIRKTQIPGLYLISSGTPPANPAELLGSSRMKELIDNLRSGFDSVVVEAPPVLAVTDACILSTLVDLVVVVIEAGRVPLKAALRMQEMLAAVNAPVAGMVLNDKSGKGREHYGYSYHKGRYYGFYGYGYGYHNVSGGNGGSWLRNVRRLLPIKPQTQKES